jgi:hypothetical protein
LNGNEDRKQCQKNVLSKHASDVSVLVVVDVEETVGEYRRSVVFVIKHLLVSFINTRNGFELPHACRDLARD